MPAKEVAAELDREYKYRSSEIRWSFDTLAQSEHSDIIAFLVSCLSNEAVRSCAESALRQVTPTLGFPHLVTALRNRDQKARNSAVRLLRLLGWATTDEKTLLLNAAENRLKESILSGKLTFDTIIPFYPCPWAIRALGFVEDDRAIALLVGILARKDEWLKVRNFHPEIDAACHDALVAARGRSVEPLMMEFERSKNTTFIPSIVRSVFQASKVELTSKQQFDLAWHCLDQDGVVKMAQAALPELRQIVILESIRIAEHPKYHSCEFVRALECVGRIRDTSLVMAIEHVLEVSHNADVLERSLSVLEKLGWNPTALSNQQLVEVARMRISSLRADDLRFLEAARKRDPPGLCPKGGTHSWFREDENQTTWCTKCGRRLHYSS